MFPSDSDLGESEGMVFLVYRQSNYAGGATVELPFDFETIGGTVWPEGCPKTHPRRVIFGGGSTNSEIGHVRKIRYRRADRRNRRGRA